MGEAQKVKCAVPGCNRKGRSNEEYLCPDHWMMVSAGTQKQFRHARKVAQRSPLPINIAVMRKTWKRAIEEATRAAFVEDET